MSNPRRDLSNVMFEAAVQPTGRQAHDRLCDVLSKSCRSIRTTTKRITTGRSTSSPDEWSEGWVRIPPPCMRWTTAQKAEGLHLPGCHTFGKASRILRFQGDGDAITAIASYRHCGSIDQVSPLRRKRGLACGHSPVFDEVVIADAIAVPIWLHAKLPVSTVCP